MKAYLFPAKQAYPHYTESFPLKIAESCSLSQTEVYEGMVVGEHTRDNDIIVNICKEKASKQHPFREQRRNRKNENSAYVCLWSKHWNI